MVRKLAVAVAAVALVSIGRWRPHRRRSVETPRLQSMSPLPSKRQAVSDSAGLDIVGIDTAPVGTGFIRTSGCAGADFAGIDGECDRFRRGGDRARQERHHGQVRRTCVAFS
jgi:hypothetical protein